MFIVEIPDLKKCHFSGNGETYLPKEGVSAAFLKPKNNSPLLIEPLLRDIGESRHAQAIRPTLVVAELIGLFGTAERVLRIVSWLVIAVFAKVIKGMDVVDRIKAVKTTRHGGHQNVPAKPVVIETVTREAAADQP